MKAHLYVPGKYILQEQRGALPRTKATSDYDNMHCGNPIQFDVDSI